MIRSELPIDHIQRVLAEASLLKRVNGESFDHVRRRPIIELQYLNMTLQVYALKNDGFQVHRVVFDSLCNQLHSILARLVLTFDGDNNPVIEYVKHLESLARDLVQYQSSPREEKIQSH